MSVDELLKDIEKCNKQILEINKRNDRERGRRDEIESNLKKQLNKYKETYGVELSLDDMESIKAEYQKVYEERKEEVEKVGKILSLIQEGRYTEVNLMLGVSQPAEEAQEDNTELKKDLIEMATNGMDSISLDIEEGVDGDNNEEQQESGFGVLSGFINGSKEDAETQQEESTVAQVEVGESLEKETKPTQEFSFEQLLNKKDDKPFEPREDVEGDKEDDHGDFFSLPESSTGIFSSFGDLTKNTRFEPK